MHTLVVLLLMIASAYTKPATSSAQPEKLKSCFTAGGGGQGITERLPIPPGNPANTWFLEESRRMNECMKAKASLHYSPSLFNALADPETDEVVLGQPLLRHAERQGPHAVSLGMGFILAHEFGHIFQFEMVDHELEKLGRSMPRIELQADVLAGYWAGARIREQRRQRGADASWEHQQKTLYLQYASSFGDYAFHSANHHGTPSQRARATQIGFDAGQSERFGSLEEAYSANARELFKWSRAQADIARGVQPEEPVRDRTHDELRGELEVLISDVDSALDQLTDLLKDTNSKNRELQPGTVARMTDAAASASRRYEDNKSGARKALRKARRAKTSDDKAGLERGIEHAERARDAIIAALRALKDINRAGIEVVERDALRYANKRPSDPAVTYFTDHYKGIIDEAEDLMDDLRDNRRSKLTNPH